MLRIKEYRKYNCNNPNLSFGEIDKKIGMFPIYFLAIRDKSNKYVSYAVVNGQTGKVAVDLPIDFKKYILISLLLTIPIFFLINSLLVLTPTKVCIFSIIAAIISLIISIYQLNKIHERENHLDDIGYMGNSNNVKHKVLKKDSNTPFLFFLTILAGILVAFLIALPFANIKTQYIQPIAIFLLISYVVGGVIIRKKNSQELEIKVYNHEYKVPKKEKFKYSYKPVLSILIGLVALLLNFVDDIYYYGATLIMFSLIIWSFYDLIKGHNLLASTKLPQLEKRGGDENE